MSDRQQNAHFKCPCPNCGCTSELERLTNKIIRSNELVLLGEIIFGTRHHIETPEEVSAMETWTEKEFEEF